MNILPPEMNLEIVKNIAKTQGKKGLVNICKVNKYYNILCKINKKSIINNLIIYYKNLLKEKTYEYEDKEIELEHFQDQQYYYPDDRYYSDNVDYVETELEFLNDEIDKIKDDIENLKEFIK